MQCGECTVCCTLSVVPDFNKKAGEHCFHCIDNGCDIYGKHPQVCKDFECAFLQGGTNIELRPDKCGVMFFKKSERIFCGVLVPEVPVTNLAKGQIDSFKSQGYSVILLKISERPFVELAEGHTVGGIYKEYIDMLMHGNL